MKTKKQWQAPKIIDLNVKNTKSGTWSASAEVVTSFGSYSYYPSSSS